MSEDAKTMEQLMVELAEARKTLDDAVEEENKASNRRRDAFGVYNGVCKRIDGAMRRIRDLAPPDTHWKQMPDIGQPV